MRYIVQHLMRKWFPNAQLGLPEFRLFYPPALAASLAVGDVMYGIEGETKVSHYERFDIRDTCMLAKQYICYRILLFYSVTPVPLSEPKDSLTIFSAF